MMKAGFNGNYEGFKVMLDVTRETGKTTGKFRTRGNRLFAQVQWDDNSRGCQREWISLGQLTNIEEVIIIG